VKGVAIRRLFVVADRDDVVATVADHPAGAVFTPARGARVGLGQRRFRKEERARYLQILSQPLCPR
jgi:hypothetical protein